MWLLILVATAPLSVATVPGTYPTKQACEADAAQVRAAKNRFDHVAVLCVRKET